MKDSRKEKLKAAGSIFLSAMAVAGDAPARARIHEIDNEIKELQEERARLLGTLINPLGSEKDELREGRLTKCKGQWSASTTFHDCHPGCPYLGTKHIAHEFTLRD